MQRGKKEIPDICKFAPTAQKESEKDGIWEVTEATNMESLMSCGVHPDDLYNAPLGTPVSSLPPHTLVGIYHVPVLTLISK